MRMPSPSTILLLLPLLCTVGCDVDEPVLDVDELELRASPADLGLKPFHGRWEGPMSHVGGNPSYDYEATLVFNPGICTLQGTDVYTAEWDYYNLGITCTSELELLGVGVLPDGKRVWTFSDQSRTGPCDDGLVDLAETGDPNVMLHTWRTLQGEIDAVGLVERNGFCTPGFGD
jgi:hypothetical protein